MESHAGGAGTLPHPSSGPNERSPDHPLSNERIFRRGMDQCYQVLFTLDVGRRLTASVESSRNSGTQETACGGCVRDRCSQKSSGELAAT